jgi:8-oxo-dGTP diphosphatase
MNAGQELRVTLGIGAVIWNAQGDCLLVRRANPPRQHEWSLPGGKVEFGETLHDALRREIREETGLDIEILGLLDVVELVRDGDAGAADAHYVLIDYSARAISGEAMAGSDAADVGWIPPEELHQIPLWSETRRIIALSAELHRGLK